MRGAFFALAFIALSLKVLAPPGFMVAATPGAQGLPIVICTAQGRQVVDPSKDHAPAHKPASEAPCAFAGNGVGSAPPIGLDAALVAAAPYQAIVNTTATDLAPGRGLAAPPPPSQGPPILL